jgi:hypothetical protein
MLKEKQPFREKRWKCHVLADSCLEMLLKAVGQPSGHWSIEKPLGDAQRLLESLWAIPKVYMKATRKYPSYLPSANRREGRIAL